MKSVRKFIVRNFVGIRIIRIGESRFKVHRSLYMLLGAILLSWSIAVTVKLACDIVLLRMIASAPILLYAYIDLIYLHRNPPRLEELDDEQIDNLDDDDGTRPTPTIKTT